MCLTKVRWIKQQPHTLAHRCECSQGEGGSTSGCRSVGCLGWHWVVLRPKEQQLPKVSSPARDLQKYRAARGQTEGTHLRWHPHSISTTSPWPSTTSLGREDKLCPPPWEFLQSRMRRGGLSHTGRLGRTLNNDSVYTGGEAAALDFVERSLGQLCGEQVQERRCWHQRDQ